MCPIKSKANFRQTYLNINNHTGVLLSQCEKGELGQRAEKPLGQLNLVFILPSGGWKTTTHMA